MNRKSSNPVTGGGRRRELHSIVLSLLFLAVGMFASWFVQTVLDVKGDAILLALLIVPVILYLTLSGRVREIAAGNLSVKMEEASREPVEETAVIPEPRALIDATKRLNIKTDPNDALFVTITYGRGDYERGKVLDGLRELAATRQVPLVIVLDSYKRVLAYMTFRSALDLLEREERGDDFIKFVNEGDPEIIEKGCGFSAVRTETLLKGTTNVDALSEMEKSGLDTLVIVDRKCHLVGFVERNRLLSKMMLALCSSPEDR